MPAGRAGLRGVGSGANDYGRRPIELDALVEKLPIALPD